MHRLSLGLFALFAFTLPIVEIAELWTEVLLAASLVSVLVTCVLERRISKPPALFYVMVALILWQLTTYYWSIDATSTFARVRLMLFALIMVWVLVELCRSEGERLLLAQSFVLGCFVLFGLIIQAYLAGQASEANRYVPSYINANDGADILAVGVAMALLIIGSRPRKLLLWTNIIFIPLAFAGVLLTASRSGFVITCLAAVGIFFVLRHARVWARLAWVVVLLAVLGVTFFTFADSQTLAQNLERITFQSDTRSLDTLTGRTTIWTAAANKFVEDPFLGAGAGTFPLAVSDELDRARAAHNIFIEGAVETGLVGVVLLAAAFVTAGSAIPRFRDHQTGLRLLLLLVMVGICMVGNFTAHYALWFVLTLLAMTGVGMETVTHTEETSSRGKSGLPSGGGHLSEAGLPDASLAIFSSKGNEGG